MAVHGDGGQSVSRATTIGIRKHPARKNPRTASKLKPLASSSQLDPENKDEPSERADGPDADVPAGPDLRTLHGDDDGNDRIHRSMLSASDDLDLLYTLQSASISDTFGVCKCLRGNVHPLDERQSCLRAWTDDVTPTASHVMADAIRGVDVGGKTCLFCKRRQSGAAAGPPTGSAAAANRNNETANNQKLKAKKPAQKCLESKEENFRHQADIGMYIKEYRRCHSVNINGGNERAPVLGKDIPDPYIQRMHSFSDVLDKLELLTMSKSSAIDLAQKKLKRTPSAPSLPEKATLTARVAPDKSQNRLESINLTPLPAKARERRAAVRDVVHHAKKRQREADDKKARASNRKNFPSDRKDMILTSDKTFTKLTNGRIVCSHVTSNLAAKKPHPSTGGKHCKKFSSSTQYLDLTSPRMAFPLPVHISLAVGRLPAGRSLYLPRCRSATSPGSEAAKPSGGAASTSTSSGFCSGGDSNCSTSGSPRRANHTRLYRSRTMNDVSSTNERRHKPLASTHSVTFLNHLSGNAKSKETTTGRLLYACLVEANQQP